MSVLRRMPILLPLMLMLFIALPVSAQSVTFAILHTNDFHGQLEPSGSNPGMARAANKINEVKTAVGEANVLLVDAGDSMQGSLLSNLWHGNSTVAVYNSMGYAATTLGNHDFDWGQTTLSDREAQATYPFLAANVVQGGCDPGNWEKPSIVDAPYTVRSVGTPISIKVAFIGVTTPEIPNLLIQSATAGLCFKDPADSIIHYYNAMKAEADVIVVLSHLGFSDGGYGYGFPVYGDQTLAQKLNTAGKPVSLIIGGHSHTNLSSSGAATIGSTKVVQAYYNGRQVGRADITFNTTTKAVESVNWQPVAVGTSGAEDPTIDALITSYATDPTYQALINQPIGYAQVDLLRNYNGDNMMGDFIDDAIYNALNNDADEGNDIDMFFNNAGGLRMDWCDKEDPVDSGIYIWSSNPADCSEGLWPHDPMLLTFAQMYSILPFGNATVVGDMTGAQILDLLNQSATLFKGAIQPAGIRFKFYRYSDALPGPQPYAWGAYDVCVINKDTSDCEPLNMNRTYRVGTNEFLAPAGQDGFLPFKYMTNITYWGDMLNQVNAWVSANYTSADPYKGPDGDGTLDQRIARDGNDAGGSITPVSILHHNDSHGNLAKGAYVGYTQLATLIKQERAHNPTRTLLLNAGDQIQGDSLMYYFRSAPLGYTADGEPLAIALQTHPMMAVMNAMGYDGMTLGEHEYNFGKEIFAGVLGQATFPIMQANVTDNGQYGLGGVPVEPYTVKTLDGIKVAIFGIGNHRVPIFELPSNIAGLTFSDPILEAQTLSDNLRASNDIVVALTHIGFNANPSSAEVDANVDTAMAESVTGLDAIIGGHSHTNPASGFGDYKFLPTIIAGPDNTPVLVHQAYRYNTNLGEVVIGTRPKSGGGYEVVSRAGRYIPVNASVPEDAEIKALVDPYMAALAVYTDTAIGQTTVPIDSLMAFTQETNAANLQADAAVFELEQQGIDVDFHLSGAMTNRKIADSATPSSPVTLKVSDMFTLMPYENSLVVLEMNGPQLKQVLERAYRNYYYYKYVPGYGGYSYYTTCMLDISAGGKITYLDLYPDEAYDPDQDYVLSLTINGQPVDFEDATTYYRVSTVNYLAAGSCNFNNGGVSLWPLDQIANDTQYYVRDAVIDYIQAMGIVSPAIEGRLEFTNDNQPPEIVVLTPQQDVAIQDGITLQAKVTDQSDIAEVLFYVRKDDGAEGIPVGFEGVPATYDGVSKIWELPFDSMLFPNDHYVFFVKATDEYGNEGWSVLVPFTIANWTLVELLPATPKNKAGRTMPIKFSLRVPPILDPEEPFVFNTELAVNIYRCGNASCSSRTLMQTSVYGSGSSNYRIDNANELYITNFKTDAKPYKYLVEVWRTTLNYMVGSFMFETVK